jgi:stress response protein YsnF
MNFAPRRQSNEIKEAGHSKSGEEVLVVEKRLVLKREIRIRMRATSETIEIPVSLRKQRAVVERQ